MCSERTEIKLSRKKKIKNTRRTKETRLLRIQICFHNTTRFDPLNWTAGRSLRDGRRPLNNTNYINTDALSLLFVF